MKSLQNSLIDYNKRESLHHSIRSIDPEVIDHPTGQDDVAGLYNRPEIFNDRFICHNNMPGTCILPGISFKGLKRIEAELFINNILHGYTLADLASIYRLSASAVSRKIEQARSKLASNPENRLTWFGK